MKRGLIISAVLHVVVISLAYFGLPALLRPPPVQDAPVVMDVVTIEEKKPAPPAKPKAPPKPPRQVTRPPPPKPLAALPAVPAPPPLAVAKPKPKPKPKPAVKHKPKPKPKPKPKAKPKPKPKQVARLAPKPRRKPKPPPDQQFQTLLKNLKIWKKTETARPPVAKPPKAAPRKVVAPRPTVRSAIDRRRSEQALVRQIRQQLAKCWYIQGGAKEARNMKIGVRVRLNSDGSLRGAPDVLDKRRYQRDGFYRAVAESALRALRNPLCSPLRLPFSEYEIWKDITFNFDPSKALGP